MASRVTTLILFTLSLLAFGDSESLHLRRDNWVVRSPLTYNPGTRSLGLDITSLTALLPASGISSLNGLTGATQTFATPGTTGTAPNWSSSGTAHTLNIPMAATSSVTAGLISKTQYDTFNGKQAALSTGTSNQWIRSDDLAPHALASADIPNNAADTTGNAATATTATNFSGSLSGDVTGTQSATAISAATVVAKLLASFSSGGSLPITSADSILVALQKINAALVPITAAEYNAGNSGSSITISWSNGNAQLITLNSATPTINLPAPVSGQNYILKLMQDETGSRVPTLTPASGSVKYSNGVAPTWTTTAGKYDLVTLYADGTNYTASVGFNF